MKFRTIFLLLSLIFTFSAYSIYAQPFNHEYDPNFIPSVIEPGQGGTVIDGNGDWFTYTSLPGGTSTSGAANAYLNGKVYHFGGSPGPSANYLEWNEATNTWTSLGTLPGGGRYYMSAETVAGKIYIIGGSLAWPTPSGLVEIFDGTTWTTGAAMPTPVHDIATAVYMDRYIYVIGGMTGGWSGHVDAVQVYDTQTNTWAAATNFPIMASCMSGGCVGNIIVVAAPYTGTSSNAIYEGLINVSNPTQITWTLSASTLRDARYRIGGGVAGDIYSNNIAFFVGGQSPYSNQACGYDPVTDTYIQYPDKPTPLGNIGNFVPGTNRMYVMGGYDGTYNVACEGMEYTMIPIPVELTSFTASVSENNVTLVWQTATEVNNSGFAVERKSVNSEYSQIGFVPGHGTTTEIMNYTFTDNSLPTGSYSYRLKQIDYDGTYEYSDALDVEVIAPEKFSLAQNYPNPFNPSTTINYSLAADSRVVLTVFNLLSEEVATLVNGNVAAGSHTIEFSADNLNSGVYFYRIDAQGVNGSNFTSVMKMILSK
jgi:hypothetical protein